MSVTQRERQRYLPSAGFLPDGYKRTALWTWSSLLHIPLKNPGHMSASFTRPNWVSLPFQKPCICQLFNIIAKIQQRSSLARKWLISAYLCSEIQVVPLIWHLAEAGNGRTGAEEGSFREGEAERERDRKYTWLIQPTISWEQQAPRTQRSQMS